MAWKDKSKPGPILIVEDDWDILEVLKLMLEDEGHAVVAAKHGREALAAANARSFDAVLMDISMPDMSGIEIAKALRANEKTRDIRIAIHTGLDEGWVRERFSDYDLFLTKAADTDVLVEKMAELMATRRSAEPAGPDKSDKTDEQADAEADPVTFSIEDAMRVKRALRSACGTADEQMPMTEFLRCIEDETGQLRSSGTANPDIAALIGRALGRPFPASLLDAGGSS